MKLLIGCLVVCACMGSLQAQVLSSPASRLRKGPGVPDPNKCVAAPDVGQVWIRSDLAGAGNPTSACGNTGAGTYGWVTTAGGAQGPAGLRARLARLARLAALEPTARTVPPVLPDRLDQPERPERPAWAFPMRRVILRPALPARLRIPQPFPRRFRPS